MRICVYSVKSWLFHGKRKNLHFHQTHTVEVNAVEHKQTHFGVLKGSFLREREV